MNDPSDSRGLASLITDLAEQAGTLMRTETMLLRAELAEKVENAGASAVEILAGAICLLAALLVLLQALVVALAKAGLGAGWSSLLVGLVVGALGVFLMRNGRNGLSAEELTPERTKHQLETDARVLKGQVK